MSEFTVSKDGLLVDSDLCPIQDLRVHTEKRSWIHLFATYTVLARESGETLRIHDARVGRTIAWYPPGGWYAIEVLRFYRDGDDPPPPELGK